MAKKATKTPVTTAATAKGAANTTALAVANATTNLAAAMAALAKVGLITMTPAERQDSNGKLRQGEATAMTDVLDTVDAYPGVFASLADKDGGVDDAVVETDPTRAHLALWAALAPILAQVDAMRTALSDTMMSAAAAAKEVTVPAYGILRANAPANPKLAKAGAVALAFYGHPAKQRAANAKKLARAKRSTASKPGT